MNGNATVDRRSFGLLIGAVAIGSALPVLAQETRVLRGSVLYRERMALPPSAILDIELLDVARADAKARVLARFRADISGGSPIGFSMRIDPAQLGPRVRPALRAGIYVDDTLWFSSTDHVALPDDPTAEVTLNVQRVASPAPAGPFGDWQASEIAGRPVPKATPATLTIAPDGAVSGSGGCNRMTGHARIKDDTIRFGRMAATMMACLGDGMEQEQRFHAALEDARRFQMDDGALVLLNAAGQPVVRLMPAK